MFNLNFLTANIAKKRYNLQAEGKGHDPRV